MELRTCEFCGTEYNRELDACPLCGKSMHEHPAPEESRQKRRLASSGGGARVAKRTGNGKKPATAASQKNWGIACVVLGIAVLIGILAFLMQMNFFRDFDPNAIPTLQQEPQDLPEYNYEQQNPQQEQPVEQPQEPQESEIVDPDACTELIISQDAVSIAEAGGRVFLTAVARPTSCKEPIRFRSMDEEVAQVNDNGMILGVGPGVTSILVQCGDVTSLCEVTCTFELPEEEPEEEPEEDPEEEPADEDEPEQTPEEEQPQEQTAPVELSSTDFTLFYPGEVAWLTVKNAPEGAAISYVSSHGGVVTVTNEGKVTAVGDGDCTITVTVGDQVLKCTARCRLSASTENNG